MPRGLSCSASSLCLQYPHRRAWNASGAPCGPCPPHLPSFHLQKFRLPPVPTCGQHRDPLPSHGCPVVLGPWAQGPSWMLHLKPSADAAAIMHKEPREIIHGACYGGCHHDLPGLNRASAAPDPSAQGLQLCMLSVPCLRGAGADFAASEHQPNGCLPATALHGSHVRNLDSRNGPGVQFRGPELLACAAPRWAAAKQTTHRSSHEHAIDTQLLTTVPGITFK